MCSYVTQSTRPPSGSQWPGLTCGQPSGHWLPEGCLVDRITYHVTTQFYYYISSDTAHSWYLMFTVKSLIQAAPHPKLYMSLVSSCSCLCPIHWSQVLSREWRCSWSSADRRCSNYIWMINNFIAYYGVTYIRGFRVVFLKQFMKATLQSTGEKEILGASQEF